MYSGKEANVSDPTLGSLSSLRSKAMESNRKQQLDQTFSRNRQEIISNLYGPEFDLKEESLTKREETMKAICRLDANKFGASVLNELKKVVWMASRQPGRHMCNMLVHFMNEEATVTKLLRFLRNQESSEAEVTLEIIVEITNLLDLNELNFILVEQVQDSLLLFIENSVLENSKSRFSAKAFEALALYYCHNKEPLERLSDSQAMAMTKLALWYLKNNHSLIEVLNFLAALSSCQSPNILIAITTDHLSLIIGILMDDKNAKKPELIIPVLEFFLQFTTMKVDLKDEEPYSQLFWYLYEEGFFRWLVLALSEYKANLNIISRALTIFSNVLSFNYHPKIDTYLSDLPKLKSSIAETYVTLNKCKARSMAALTILNIVKSPQAEGHKFFPKYDGMWPALVASLTFESALPLESEQIRVAEMVQELVAKLSLAELETFTGLTMVSLADYLCSLVQANRRRHPEFIFYMLQAVLNLLEKLEAVGNHQEAADRIRYNYDEVFEAISNLSMPEFSDCRKLSIDIDSRFLCQPFLN